jgi:integrase
MARLPVDKEARMRGYLVKKGNRYYAVVYEGTDPLTRKERRSWTAAGRSRREAERVLAELVQARNGRCPVFPERMRLATFLTESWLPARRSSLRPSTFDRYEREILVHINPLIGHISLHRVRAAELDALYDALLDHGRCDGRGLAPKTVLNIHQILRASLGDACRRGLAVRNEALLAHPPVLRARYSNKPSAWTATQLAAFLRSSKAHRLWPAIYLAATTGMRRGEVLGLRWGDIDLDARRVSVHRTIVAIAYETAESTVKTRHSRRVVDLASDTIGVLLAWRLQRFDEGGSIGPDDLVFTRPDGTILHPHTLSQAFERLVIRSGQPVIRFHDLRHTHATLLLKSGVPLKVVSERLGHATPAFTMAVYQHVLPGMQAEAASVFAALIARSDTPEAYPVEDPVEECA